MDEVEREYCLERFQVDILKITALYHFPFIKVRIFFASLPVYVISSVHNMLFFGSAYKSKWHGHYISPSIHNYVQSRSPLYGKSKQMGIRFSTWGCLKVTLTLLVHLNYKACSDGDHWLCCPSVLPGKFHQVPHPSSTEPISIT